MFESRHRIEVNEDWGFGILLIADSVRRVDPTFQLAPDTSRRLDPGLGDSKAGFDFGKSLPRRKGKGRHGNPLRLSQNKGIVVDLREMEGIVPIGVSLEIAVDEDRRLRILLIADPF